MAGKITVSTINDSSGVLATQNGMTGIAKAWVNFAGSTGTVNSSFNVSSVTRTSSGNYTVNYTTAIPNANYVVSGGFTQGSSSYPFNLFISSALATSNFSFTTTGMQTGGTGITYDPTAVWVVINGS